MSAQNNHLCNWTVESIQENIDYHSQWLKDERPQVAEMAARSHEDFTARLESAKSRFYVGVDDKGAKVYISTSSYSESTSVLFVEGKPSGWEISEISNGEVMKVCYDGGGKWWGTITFDKDWKQENSITLINLKN